MIARQKINFLIKLSKNLNELNTFKKLKVFKDRKSKETIKNSKNLHLVLLKI